MKLWIGYYLYIICILKNINYVYGYSSLWNSFFNLFPLSTSASKSSSEVTNSGESFPISGNDNVQNSINRLESSSTLGVDSPIPRNEYGSRIEFLIQEAEQFIQSDNYSAAITSLLEVLESVPNHPKACSMIGYCFLTVDEPAVAENFLYTAIHESNHTDSAAIINFIESLKLNAKYDVAISFLFHLKSFPQNAIADFENRSDYSINYLLGTIYEYKKDFSIAQDWYFSAALQRPTNVPAWLRASTILFPTEHKNLTLAESVLLQGIQYNPSSADLIFNLASLLHATNRLSEAKIFYEESLRLNPSMASAMANLATVLHTTGQLSEARSFYEKAIPLAKNNSILLANYALCLSSLKLHSAAYRAIEEATQLDPQDPAIQTDKKKLLIFLQNSIQMKERLLDNINKLFTNRNFDEIINTLISYGEPLEDGAWWYYTMGIVEYFRKQYKNSIYYCGLADTLTNRQSLLINSCLGLAHQSLGMSSESNLYFEKSYKLINATEMMPYFVFQISDNDVKYNLLQSYSINSRFDNCLTTSCEMLNLPSLKDGGMIVLTFSYVKWSQRGEKRINEYQEGKIPNIPHRSIQIRSGKFLSEEISRVQSLAPDLRNTVYSCVNSLDSENQPEYFDLRNDAFNILDVLANYDDLLPPKSSTDAEEINQQLRPLVLFSSFFFPPHVITSHDRQVSVLLQNSLQQNLNNPLITEVILVNQIEYNFSKLVNFQKIKQYIINRRITYADLFTLANQILRSDALAIFAPCDIIFDSTLQSLQKNYSFFRSNGDGSPLLALTPWSTTSTNSNIFSLTIRIDKQEAWILKPPIPASVISISDFTMSSKRSDNRLAHIFLDAGYRIYNPAFTIRAIQRDPLIRNHSLFMNADVAIGKYSDVYFSDSGIFET